MSQVWNRSANQEVFVMDFSKRLRFLSSKLCIPAIIINTYTSDAINQIWDFLKNSNVCRVVDWTLGSDYDVPLTATLVKTQHFELS